MKFSNEEYLLTGGNLDLKEAKRGFIVSIFNNPIKIFETMKTTEKTGINALQLCCTRLASEKSCACTVMNAFHLTKVVQIFVPYADKEKLQQLKDNLRDELICELPLRNGSKTLLYCVLMPELNTEQNLFVYLMELERVYGKNGELKGPFHCRVYEFADFEGDLS